MVQDIFTGKVLANEGLVDQRKRSAPRHFALLPEASLNQWDMEDSEILRAYKVCPRFLLFSRVLTQDLERLRPPVARWRGVGGNAR